MRVAQMTTMFWWCWWLASDSDNKENDEDEDDNDDDDGDGNGSGDDIDDAADDDDALLADNMCSMDVYHVYTTADDKCLKKWWWFQPLSWFWWWSWFQLWESFCFDDDKGVVYKRHQNKTNWEQRWHKEYKGHFNGWYRICSLPWTWSLVHVWQPAGFWSSH